MLQNKRRMAWMLVWLAMASALWALNVEVTYEHNARRIPAEFQPHNPHRAVPWRI